MCIRDRCFPEYTDNQHYSHSYRKNKPGDDLSMDKYLFRKIAVDWGVDESLVYASKSPLQVSSGGLDSVVRLARESLSRDFEGRTYSSPIDEPLEFVVARLFLGGLADR